MDYDSLIEACNDYLENDNDYCLSDDTPDEAWSENEKMWEHFEIVSEMKIEDNKRQNFFRCAC